MGQLPSVDFFFICWFLFFSGQAEISAHSRGLWSPAHASLFLLVERQATRAHSQALATFYYPFHLDFKSLSSDAGFQN